jgi:hypothetical protein
MAEVETFYGAISGWESPKLGGMKLSAIQWAPSMA